MNPNSIYVKYPRTKHLPNSPGASENDLILDTASHFSGKEIVITTKMDGENCLDENTIVLTENGEKTIREICEEKYTGNILSFNIENNKQCWDKCQEHFIQNISDDWYEIELENGISIKLTGKHLVFLPKLNCYRQVCDLIENDEVLLKK